MRWWPISTPMRETQTRVDNLGRNPKGCLDGPRIDSVRGQVRPIRGYALAREPDKGELKPPLSRERVEAREQALASLRSAERAILSYSPWIQAWEAAWSASQSEYWSPAQTVECPAERESCKEAAFANFAEWLRSNTKPNFE